MDKINPSRSLMCCFGCGRDTKSVYGFCGECQGHYFCGRGRGRKARTTNVLEFDSEDVNESSYSDYHGDIEE